MSPIQVAPMPSHTLQVLLQLRVGSGRSGRKGSKIFITSQMGTQQTSCSPLTSSRFKILQLTSHVRRNDHAISWYVSNRQADANIYSPRWNFFLERKRALLRIMTKITDKIWGYFSFPGCMVTFLRGNITQLLSLKTYQLRYKERGIYWTSLPKMGRTRIRSQASCQPALWSF